jgi:hypothetical protein
MGTIQLQIFVEELLTVQTVLSTVNGRPSVEYFLIFFGWVGMLYD